MLDDFQSDQSSEDVSLVLFDGETSVLNGDQKRKKKVLTVRVDVDGGQQGTDVNQEGLVVEGTDTRQVGEGSGQGLFHRGGRDENTELIVAS